MKVKCKCGKVFDVLKRTSALPLHTLPEGTACEGTGCIGVTVIYEAEYSGENSTEGN